MKTKLFIITTPKLRETGDIWVGNLFPIDIPQNFRGRDTWGIVVLRSQDETDKMWGIHLCNVYGNVCNGGAKEVPPHNEGLQGLVRDVTKEIDSVALVMERDLLERFTAVCSAIEIAFQVHEYEHPMSTS
ncbi:MAG: hypothetical protein AAB649_01300 [Patescibacteria group bacterium]